MKDFAGDCQKDVIRILCENDWIKSKHIQFFAQDSCALPFLIETELAKLDHLVAVVAIDRIEPEGDEAANISASVIVTESVPMNRINPGFATALQAAQHMGQILHSENYLCKSVDHEAIEGGVLVATVRLSTIFS